MVTTIVIPQDGGGAPRVQELAGASDFQEVTGGWLEPIEIGTLGITVWVNEAAPREHGVMNARATALYWHYSLGLEFPRLLLGDVVITGSDDGENGMDAPEHLIHGLLATHHYVVQVSPDDDDNWNDTFARFENIYDAALWCMLFARSFQQGSAFRVLVQTPSDVEHLMQEDGSW